MNNKAQTTIFLSNINTEDMYNVATYCKFCLVPRSQQDGIVVYRSFNINESQVNLCLLLKQLEVSFMVAPLTSRELFTFKRLEPLLKIPSIARLVKNAQSAKAPIQCIADVISTSLCPPIFHYNSCYIMSLCYWGSTQKWNS